MQILGLNKTTLLDYPGHVAATIFTGGCNFRCPFCYNRDLVLYPDKLPCIPEDEVFSFLTKRRSILSGVCITGGEPTLQSDLVEFIKRIKDLGYLVKLDTNGYRPQVIKSCLSDYEKVTDLLQFNTQIIEESISTIMSCGIAYEFRTTVVRELHSETTLLTLAQMIYECKAYYLQSYQNSKTVAENHYHSYSKEELLYLLNQIKKIIPHAILRGVD